MGKIYVPSNIYLTKNARKNIESIEKNHNYDPFVDDINEMLEFASTTPKDFMTAQANGWQPEKLNTGKKEFIMSFRINIHNRFTYRVCSDGSIELLGVLGHYVGTGYGLYKPDFGDVEELIKGFYNGTVSYGELIKGAPDIKIIPNLEDEDKDRLNELKEKIVEGTLQSEDINSLEIDDGDNHFYLNREDFQEEKENEEEAHHTL